jgi:hypothetical protein
VDVDLVPLTQVVDRLAIWFGVAEKIGGRM